MKRTVALVDGFNLFHALNSQERSPTDVDLVSLCSRLLNRKKETLYEVVFFSALATHLSDHARRRQMKYLHQLEASGVKVVLGNFKKSLNTCRSCGFQAAKHEEKETDVNLALAIFEISHNRQVGKVLLFSADTDMVPAVRKAKALNPDLEIRIVSTQQYLRNVSRTLILEADGQIRLTEDLVRAHQFTNL